MSFTVVVVMMILLGPSAVIAFVLQPSKEEPAASANSLVCQGESLQSIRKGLLGSLNLPAEPRLPAGGTIAHRPTLFPVCLILSGLFRCCSTASEIFMKDLGWDNWVIHPASLTIVQCALCHPEGNTGQCPSPHANDQDADSQVPCCEPISQEMVPILYVDEFSNLVISSVQLTRSCGCDPGDLQPPSRE
uniref:TGF-beta family profile domain-containing protein n=1 Tax=Cyclopterus lumpus TaxID=8103 RepID=A0A8C2WJ66_CYCLU